MRRYLLLLAMLLNTTLFAKPITPTQKLHATAKVWGFLKYYHPEVAKGSFDWDQQLTAIIDKTKSVEDSEVLSKIYLDWIDGLGIVKPCKSCSKQNDNKYFDKNFDLSWTQNQDLFSPELVAKLKYIEQNRFEGKPYYFTIHSGVGNIKIQNEVTYDKSTWESETMRLLTLFRYWNQIEYFFPYKYMTDTKWDDVLLEMIPKFRAASTQQELHLAMLELVVKIDDGHALFITPLTNSHFGYKWAPIKYKIIDQKVIVTGYRDQAKAEKDDLLIGDVIEKIDGKTTAEIIKSQFKYISGSNMPAKLNNMYYAFLNGSTDSVRITFSRNGMMHDKLISRYLLSDFIAEKKPVKSWELRADNIGYINMGNLQNNEVDDAMKDLRNTKAIIVDIRNYPNGTLYQLANHLLGESADFVKFTMPDPSYPGKFTWSSTLTAGQKKNVDYYKGKVVLLVNEETQSHAEFTAMALQKAPNVVTIGSQTAAADGNVSILETPDGSKSYISGIGVFYPNGTETQRIGVKVDIEVKPTIGGIQSGRDEVLEKALEVIAQ